MLATDHTDRPTSTILFYLSVNLFSVVKRILLSCLFRTLSNDHVYPGLSDIPSAEEMEELRSAAKFGFGKNDLNNHV